MQGFGINCCQENSSGEKFRFFTRVKKMVCCNQFISVVSILVNSDVKLWFMQQNGPLNRISYHLTRGSK